MGYVSCNVQALSGYYSVNAKGQSVHSICKPCQGPAGLVPRGKASKAVLSGLLDPAGGLSHSHLQNLLVCQSTCFRNVPNFALVELLFCLLHRTESSFSKIQACIIDHICYANRPTHAMQQKRSMCSADQSVRFSICFAPRFQACRLRQQLSDPFQVTFSSQSEAVIGPLQPF